MQPLKMIIFDPQLKDWLVLESFKAPTVYYYYGIKSPKAFWGSNSILVVSMDPLGVNVKGQ